MPTNHVDEQLELQRKLGVTRPPEKITQEAFEGDDRHLRRLARLRTGEVADGDDLWEYVHDLRHTEIQTPLFVYLLPFCLKVWRDDLRGVEGHGGIVEHFYAVLANRHVFDLQLNQSQGEVVSEFMQQAILEEIDNQRGLTFHGARARPYRWFRSLTTYAVLRPDVGRLWNQWWALDTVARAVAAVQYISCLMYSETENPVFAPWTPDGGGGPPVLWEFEGHLDSHRWLQPNVDFLKATLTFETVEKILASAVGCLAAEPEHDIATTVRADFPLCEKTVRLRCSDLPRLLETVQDSSSELSWSA